MDRRQSLEPSLTVGTGIASLVCVFTSACTYDFDQYIGEPSAIAGAFATSSTPDGSGGRSTSTRASGGTVSTTPGGSQGAMGGSQAAMGGTQAAGGSASTSTAAICAGVPSYGLCWYLGALGSSCQQVCGSHGQLAPTMASHVGTPAQGGSLAKCASLLSLLGATGAPTQGMRTDGLGFGCHVFSAQTDGLWWLTSPNFSPTASGQVRIVCGCTE